MGTIGKRGKTTKLTKKDFSEYFIQQVLAKDFMTNPKYEIFNLYVYDWESDFLLITKAGYSYEVEIKISLEDFMNDFKNKADKYFILENGYKTMYKTVKICKDKDGQIHRKEEPYEVSCSRPNYFGYCVPYYLVDKIKQTLPDYAGLWYINEYAHLVCVHKPEKLNVEPVDEDKLKLKEKFYYAYCNWRDRSLKWHDREKELKATISWLKAEFKAATGFDIKEVF